MYDSVESMICEQVRVSRSHATVLLLILEVSNVMISDIRMTAKERESFLHARQHNNTSFCKRHDNTSRTEFLETDYPDVFRNLIYRC